MYKNIIMLLFYAEIIATDIYEGVVFPKYLFFLWNKNF